MSSIFAVLFVIVVALYMLRKKCKKRFWYSSVGVRHYAVTEVSNNCDTNDGRSRSRIPMLEVIPTVNDGNTTQCVI